MLLKYSFLNTIKVVHILVYVVAKVAPRIKRCRFALDRQVGITLVQERAYQHLALLVAVENNLQIGCHRRE